MPTWFDELSEFLRIPSVSADQTHADDVVAVGELLDENKRSSHAYAQIWQYNPKVANWGLRILLINPLAPVMSK